MSGLNPRPWQPCGSLRLYAAAPAMWLLDRLAAALMALSLYRAAGMADAALVRVGVWSGVISDGRD